MGEWMIVVRGTGAHHNGKPEVDADIFARTLPQGLRAIGQNVESITFTVGDKTEVLYGEAPVSANPTVTPSAAVGSIAGVVKQLQEELEGKFPDLHISATIVTPDGGSVSVQASQTGELKK